MSCLNNCTKCNTSNSEVPYVVCDSCGKVFINNKEHTVKINHYSDAEIEKDPKQHKTIKTVVAFAMQNTDMNDWDPS